MAKIQRDWIADNAVDTGQLEDDAVTPAKLDEGGSFTPTGAWDFTGGSMTVPTPSGDNDVANKGYVDSVAAGLDWKDSARVRAQGNVSVSAPGVNIDGVAMNVDDRVLMDQQSATTEDGIYLWKGAAVSMVRTADAQVGAAFAGAALFIDEGTDADLAMVCTNNAPNDVVGTDDLNFTTFSGGAVVHALGGAAHSADTLANLNSKVSDGTLVDKDTANTWTEKQQFTSGAATDAPAGLTEMASDPSSPQDGDIWPLTTGEMKARLNGATKRLDENIVQEMHKVTAGEVSAGYFTLASSPVNAQSVRVCPHGGVPQANKQTVGATGATPDFDVLSTNQVHINNNGAATGLSGDITTDDILIVEYQK